MSQDVQYVQVNLEQARKAIELSESLDRLHNNPDFQKVILEGYFKDEAIRLVHLKGDFHMQKPEDQASIIRQMDALSSLKYYFRTINHIAMLSEKAIEDEARGREEDEHDEGLNNE